MAMISKIKVIGLLLTKTDKAQIPAITCLHDWLSGKSVTRSKNAVFEKKKRSFPRLMLRFLYGNFKLRS